MTFTHKHGGKRTPGPGKKLGRPNGQNGLVYGTFRAAFKTQEECDFVSSLNPADRGDALIGQITRSEWYALDPPRRKGGRRLRPNDGSKQK